MTRTLALAGGGVTGGGAGESLLLPQAASMSTASADEMPPNKRRFVGLITGLLEVVPEVKLGAV
jgi:hypothetical protein